MITKEIPSLLSAMWVRCREGMCDPFLQRQVGRSTEAQVSQTYIAPKPCSRARCDAGKRSVIVTTEENTFVIDLPGRAFKPCRM